MIDAALPSPYLCNREQWLAAEALMTRFGALAGEEAAIRAGRSRDLGNHVHFCRWRQVERFIDLLAAGGADGTTH